MDIPIALSDISHFVRHEPDSIILQSDKNLSTIIMDEAGIMRSDIKLSILILVVQEMSELVHKLSTISLQEIRILQSGIKQSVL